MGMPAGGNGSLAFYDWFWYEIWRFVLVEQEIEKFAKTAIDFPPMQKGANEGLQAIKAQIARAAAKAKAGHH
jgi:arylsulfatase